jgi:hypothetical protein
MNEHKKCKYDELPISKRPKYSVSFQQPKVEHGRTLEAVKREEETRAALSRWRNSQSVLKARFA